MPATGVTKANKLAVVEPGYGDHLKQNE